MFCVVRNPFDRIVSEYRYQLTRSRRSRLFRNQICSADGLNNYIAKYISKKKNVSGEDFSFNCHLVKQSAYIHTSKGGNAGSLGCTTLLRFETLERDFLNFTKQTKMALDSLGGTILNNRSNDTRCNVTSDDLSTASVSYIASAYAQDFHILQYSTNLPLLSKHFQRKRSFVFVLYEKS